MPVGSHDASDAAAVLEHARHGDALCDADAPLPRALHERHRHVDGVDAPVALDVEAAVDVRRVAEREEAPNVCGADLLDVDATEAVERGDAAELLHAVCVCGDLDEANGLEARRDARLCLEPGIQVALQSARANACSAAGEMKRQPCLRTEYLRRSVDVLLFEP